MDMDLAAPGAKAVGGEGGGTGPSDPFNQYVIIRSSATPAEGGTVHTQGGTEGIGLVISPNGFVFANNSDAEMVICDGDSASATRGFPVAPGQIFALPSSYPAKGPWSLWCAYSGKPYTYRVW